MILTLARGVLAAHSGDPARTVALRSAGVDELAHAVLEVEQGRWIRTASTQQRQGLLPAGLRAEAFVEAMLALVLTGPTTAAAATTTLRRLPALRGEPEKLLGNLVAWAHDLYPSGGGSLVAPAPDFLQAALVASSLGPTGPSCSFTSTPTWPPTSRRTRAGNGPGLSWPGWCVRSGSSRRSTR